MSPGADRGGKRVSCHISETRPGQQGIYVVIDTSLLENEPKKGAGKATARGDIAVVGKHINFANFVTRAIILVI